MEVWIDVGAHLGEKSLEPARRQPNELLVYAFEPNLAVARRLVGSSWGNYVVMPLVVSSVNGEVEFHFNADERCSSIRRIDPDGLAAWKGHPGLRETGTLLLPSIRLDTFLGIYEIEEVDWLKIDAQGADEEVLRSLGHRIRDVKRVTVEVQTTEVPLYQKASTKTGILDYMSLFRFALVDVEPQSLGQEENLTFERTP